MTDRAEEEEETGKTPTQQQNRKRQPTPEEETTMPTSNKRKESARKLLQTYHWERVARVARRQLVEVSGSSERYYVPSDEDVPALLLDLTSEEIRQLRPFDIHCGDYVKHQHGYWERTGPFHRAYTYLMSRGESAYRDFVEMHASRESDLQLFEIFFSPKYHGIECALWPSLSHTKTMCESVLEGSTSCESGKVAFMAKLLSPVAGYQLEYEQIHYQTIGNGNTGLFWTQYGFPTFFLTISPYEWSFLWPPWLESLRVGSGCAPTELPAIETIHIAHVLKQLIRVPTERDTVHLHLLVWLKDARLCRSSLFHASIPCNVKEDPFTVASTQKSDKSVLDEDEGPDRFETGQNGPQLRFHYTPEDQQRNIRAYITTFLDL
ncbi:hypothetical protein OS493_030360 [Desmophyllum pertusum]|uniref:Uncharacterized protein n=1 Tax=Desmophyllum pertusum TaxID=174260 RepID=A0A9W9Z8K0_9CNID|nr:hypothetical protein OS493_030360 [Desmophyllum pertusum]